MRKAKDGKADGGHPAAGREARGGGAAQAVVDVVADYGRDGSVVPREIEWGDGRAWPVERIAAVRAQPGGQLLRFTCRVREQWMYLLLPARLAG